MFGNSTQEHRDMLDKLASSGKLSEQILREQIANENNNHDDWRWADDHDWDDACPPTVRWIMDHMDLIGAADMGHAAFLAHLIDDEYEIKNFILMNPTSINFLPHETHRELITQAARLGYSGQNHDWVRLLEGAGYTREEIRQLILSILDVEAEARHFAKYGNLDVWGYFSPSEVIDVLESIVDRAALQILENTYTLAHYLGREEAEAEILGSIEVEGGSNDEMRRDVALKIYHQEIGDRAYEIGCEYLRLILENAGPHITDLGFEQALRYAQELLTLDARAELAARLPLIREHKRDYFERNHVKVEHVKFVTWTLLFLSDAERHEEAWTLLEHVLGHMTDYRSCAFIYKEMIKASTYQEPNTEQNCCLIYHCRWHENLLRHLQENGVTFTKCLRREHKGKQRNEAEIAGRNGWRIIYVLEDDSSNQEWFFRGNELMVPTRPPEHAYRLFESERARRVGFVITPVKVSPGSVSDHNLPFPYHELFQDRDDFPWMRD